MNRCENCKDFYTCDNTGYYEQCTERRTNMKTYTVTVNFAGFIGCEETYEIYAASREEAEREALEEAMSDLEVVDIDEESEDEDYE